MNASLFDKRCIRNNADGIHHMLTGDGGLIIKDYTGYGGICSCNGSYSAMNPDLHTGLLQSFAQL
ncbi:hypothetical protein D3C75_1321580 [compost metagenome]